MATAMVTVRLDAEDKAAMERACKEMGLSMNTAFTIFAKKVAREQRVDRGCVTSSGPLRPGRIICGGKLRIERL